jgi:hypothetical protein
MAALTTSQSATTKSIVPIGIAIGLPAQVMIAMWPSLIGVFFLPANGTQLAAVSADRTGSTKIGSAVINHSFQPNTIFMWIVTVIVGIIIAVIIHGTAAADSELSESPPAEVTATEEAPAEETPAAETPAAEEPTPEEAAPTEEALATEGPAEEAVPTEEAAAPTEVPVETPSPAVTP